jgi:hypothetical protein
VGNEAEGRSKDLTQRAQRKGGEKSEKDKNAYCGGAEGTEKSGRDPCLRQAGFGWLEAKAPLSV